LDVIFALWETHRDDGKRFVVRSDEKLTAFLETEKVTHAALTLWTARRRLKGV
jgi:hypothetical protein